MTNTNYLPADEVHAKVKAKGTRFASVVFKKKDGTLRKKTVVRLRAVTLLSTAPQRKNGVCSAMMLWWSLSDAPNPRPIQRNWWFLPRS